MLSKLKYALAAAAFATAPMSAHALSFYTDITAGGTYEIGTGNKRITAVAVKPEGANSFDVIINNGTPNTQTLGFGTKFFGSTLPNLSITVDGTVYSGAFSLALLSGMSKTINVAYGALSGGERIGVVLSSVPVPAGGVLLLTALGAAAATRRRKATKGVAVA